MSPSALAPSSRYARSLQCLEQLTKNDIHRLNNSVANSFFKPAPGKMFEVIDGTATPLCSFDNANGAINRDETRHERYTNYLGRNLPVAPLLKFITPTEMPAQQVQLDWAAFSEGLTAGFEAHIDADCEQNAQEAYNRGSVVCVVDNVLRRPETNEIVGVRFKPHAFIPEGGQAEQLCPLKSPEDTFWKIRKPFISITVVTITDTNPAVVDLRP